MGKWSNDINGWSIIYIYIIYIHICSIYIYMYINNYTIIYIYTYVCVIFKQTMELIKQKTEASFPIRCFGFADFRASHHRLQDRRRMAERCKILWAADRDQWLKKLQTYSVWCVQFTWRKILKWRINVHLTLWTVFFCGHLHGQVLKCPSSLATTETLVDGHVHGKLEASTGTWFLDKATCHKYGWA